MIATIKAAILSLTMLSNGAQVAHMRHAPGGAEQRAQYLASMIYDASQVHGVDPLLVVAVIYTESGFDSHRSGSLHEFGLMQLHPRSPWGKQASRACKDNRELCDWAVIFEGTKLLGWAVNKCETYRLAVGAYRTRGGRCVRIDGADKVLRVYRRIGGGSS